MSAELDPPDKKQCQAEKPNGNTFMTLGGRPGLVRCEALPKVIVTEMVPGDDDEHGAMSLCGQCLTVFNEQSGTPMVTVEVI